MTAAGLELDRDHLRVLLAGSFAAPIEAAGG